jgi:hypothetical protein
MIDQNLVAKLNQLTSFDTNNDVMEFLDIIGNIATNGDVSYLPVLSGFLSDKPDLIDVRDSIMMAIETYTDYDYVTYLLTELETILIKIPRCTIMFFWTIFNTTSCLQVLKQNIHLAAKETILKLLKNMENDKYCPDKHKPIIRELRELVEG